MLLTIERPTHQHAFFVHVSVFFTQGIYQRHAPVLLTMARGVWELRESFALKNGKPKSKSGMMDFYDVERV